MGTVKMVMAFPMFGAAAWLTWVLAQQAGPGGLAVLLGCFVALGFAAWIYGLAQKRRMMGQKAWGLYTTAGAVAAVMALAVLRPDGGIPAHPSRRFRLPRRRPPCHGRPGASRNCARRASRSWWISAPLGA
jgi:thiol:disulfide interchange protein DsbD